MKGLRGPRLGEEIRRELAEILRDRVRDPGLGAVGVTRVEVSSDGSHARVYVSFLGDEASAARGLAALERAGGFIRRELAQRLAVRRVPGLAFRHDHGVEHSIRVQQELRALGLEPEPAPERDGETGDSGRPGEDSSSPETGESSGR